MFDVNHPYAQNANLTKWGAHTLGMDEWSAFETYEAAAAHSFEINLAMQSRDRHNDILCFSYPAPWPWDAESHALDLAKTKEEGM